MRCFLGEIRASQVSPSRSLQELDPLGCWGILLDVLLQLRCTRAVTECFGAVLPGLQALSSCRWVITGSQNLDHLWATVPWLIPSLPRTELFWRSQARAMCSPPGVPVLWSRLAAGRLLAGAGGSSRLCVAVIASPFLLGSLRDGARRGVTWHRPPSWVWGLAARALPEAPGSLVWGAPALLSWLHGALG